MELKDKLKQRRLELGLTLDDVARIVNVSGATISRWESGNIENMRRDKIALLAKALQVSPSYIMGWDSQNEEKNESNNEQIVIPKEKTELYELARMANKMPPEEVAKIRDMIKIMFPDAFNDK